MVAGGGASVVYSDTVAVRPTKRDEDSTIRRFDDSTQTVGFHPARTMVGATSWPTMANIPEHPVPRLGKHMKTGTHVISKGT